jgi:hypothetical protein
MDFEDGPSRVEGFALYLNSYFVGVIGLVAAAAREDSFVPIWFAASVVGMLFLPLALIGFALTPLAARRAWYFLRLVVALAVVLTVLTPTLDGNFYKAVRSSYVAGILRLLAVSAVIRAAAAGTAASASSRDSSDK